MAIAGFTFRAGIDLNYVVDDTAPVLTSPSGTQTGGTTADLSVSTDEGNGTVYWVVTQSAAAPTATQVKAGQDHTGSSADDAGSISVVATGTQTDGATGLSVSTQFYAHFMHEDSSANQSTVVTSSSFTTPADSTAPTLSSPSASETGDTTASLSVSSDEANGTLYWVVTQSATGPSAAQIKAGQDHTGAAADDNGSQSVTATGTQNANSTGLAEQTTYYAHFMHEDAAANQSTVATSASFTTDATADTTAPILTSPSGSATGTTAANVSVSTDEANGTAYWVITQSATPPSKAQVKAGQDHTGSAADAADSVAVSSTGAQNDSATGLTAATTYYVHWMHEDAAANQSDVATSSSFMTNGAQPSFAVVTKKLKDSSSHTGDSTAHTQTSGNKLLIIAVSHSRDGTQRTGTITYNGASPDSSDTLESQYTADGNGQIAYGYFNSPSSGSNTVSVTWSGNVQHHAIYAIDIDYAGALAAVADNQGKWGDDVDHNASIGAAGSLLIVVAEGRNCTIFSGFSATGMTTQYYDETNGSDTTGLCVALVYEEGPSTGTKSIDGNFTATNTDWVFGASFVIAPTT